MPLEEISSAVLHTARTEADHMIKAAEHAAEDKVRRARQAAEQENDRRYQAAVRDIEEEFRRKLTQVSGAGKKELLAEKSRCMQRLFETARQRILALPQEEYLAVMARLVERAAQGSTGRLRVHPEDKALFTRVVQQYKAGHPGAGAVTLDETSPLPERGGFIFMSDTYQVDQTLRTLLSDLEYQIAPAVSAKLFGREAS